MKRHEAMNARVKEGNVDLVFIGDSITQGWEGRGKEVWQKFYDKRNAVNLGIGGDRTQHVIWRLDNGNLEGISPKLAVIMIGTNNSGTNTPEQIADGTTAIVKQLRTKTPQTKILVLGVFPRGESPADPKRQVNEKTNAIVSKLADGEHVFYLDFGKNFLQDDGTLTREIMPDLLHPNAENWFSAPYDCHYANPVPDWGQLENPADDPSLDIDDINGAGPENVNLDLPENTDVLGAPYLVGVHYYNSSDRLTGFDYGPSFATVRVFINGELSWDGRDDLENGRREMEAEDHFWDVVQITWPDGNVTTRNRYYNQRP